MKSKQYFISQDIVNVSCPCTSTVLIVGPQHKSKYKSNPNSILNFLTVPKTNPNLKCNPNPDPKV